MIENVSTQLTVFHCFAHCLLPGRAFASLYALLFLEKEAEIGGRVHYTGKHTFFSTDNGVLVSFCFLKAMFVLGHQGSDFFSNVILYVCMLERCTYE